MLADLALDAGCLLGEGPVWDDRQQVLRFVDIAAGHVHRFDPATGDHSSVAVHQPVSALALTHEDGELLLALRDGFGMLSEPTGTISLLVGVEADDPTTRMNDGKCDARGRFWAGTMAVDFAPERGTLYCLEAGPPASVRAALPGATLSNGLAWSADNRVLFYVDSATGRIDAIDYDIDSGMLGRRRPHIVIDAALGMPDGVAMDVEGGFWVGMWGGGAVWRFHPDGRPDRAVSVPASQVTSCAFGGPGLDVLYITTASEGLTTEDRASQPNAGCVFAASVGAVGYAPARFGGPNR
jgi:sugar lactone lactonase YvrE